MGAPKSDSNRLVQRWFYESIAIIQKCSEEKSIFFEVQLKLEFLVPYQPTNIGMTHCQYSIEQMKTPISGKLFKHATNWHLHRSNQWLAGQKGVHQYRYFLSQGT